MALGYNAGNILVDDLRSSAGVRTVSNTAEVEFLGFADGCRVQGRVAFQDARLADMLNRQSRILVRDAVVVRTSDGFAQAFGELELDRDELDIVVAEGPRGDPKRRRATACDCVSMQLGPYSAEGFMHSPQRVTVAGLEDPPPMVAVTDAVLEYEFGNESRSEWFRTLLVNRDLATSIRTVVVSDNLAATIA
jgi:hypothetical protein